MTSGTTGTRGPRGGKDQVEPAAFDMTVQTNLEGLQWCSFHYSVDEDERETAQDECRAEG